MAKKKVFYIAYGSNMSMEQMTWRCPDAEFYGTGYLNGWQLEFYTHATIVEKTGAKTPVAVWKVSEDDIQSLNVYEGYPRYYGTKAVTVEMIDGTTVTGFVYIMNWVRGSEPAYGYFRGIVDAYARVGFLDDISGLNEALERSVKKNRKQGAR